jgi:DNA-binding beta-propeller fold protein YncE
MLAKRVVPASAVAAIVLVGAASQAVGGAGPTQLWTPLAGGRLAVFSTDSSKVFIAGPQPAPFRVTAFSAASPGGELWEDFFHVSDDQFQNSSSNALAVSPDGTKVFVSGTALCRCGVGANLDYFTVAYPATQRGQLWYHRYDPAAHADDVATSLVVGPNNSRVYVTGYSTDASGGADYATVAINASNGHRLWAKRYDDAAHGDDRATAIALSPDGTKLFVTGESGSATNHDFMTIAYDAATGALLWLHRFDGPAGGDDVPAAVAVNPDGSAVYVAGSVTNATGGGPQNLDFATVAYSTATGSQLWSATYAGSPSGADELRALAVSPSGQKIYVTGPSSNGTNLD